MELEQLVTDPIETKADLSPNTARGLPAKPHTMMMSFTACIM